MTLEIDFETRSHVNLKTAGVYVYMADQSIEPLMASYRIDGGPIRRWRPLDPCPSDIVEHIAAGRMISAHNAAFERLLMQMVLAPRYGWPYPKTEQFRCTAATAAALALPRSLGDLGAALGLAIQKDKAGEALIRKFSIPNRKGEFNEPSGPDFEAFHDYCDQDVRAEADADRRMVSLSADEQRLYALAERINDRGLRIDHKSARSALRLAERAKSGLDREMRLATGGYVTACSQPGKLIEWIQAQGIEITSAAKGDVLALLDTIDLPANVRRTLELRQEAAKTSVAKLKAMLARSSTDGRVRGTFMFNGASTGRWTNMGVNFANLPRPRKCYEDSHPDLPTLFRAIRSEDPELLKFLYGEELGRPLHLLSDAIRSFIWAAPGHEFIQADYTGIEGAVIAWSSGEQWKLDALFEIMIDPSKPDMYRRAAAGIMGMTTDEIDKKHPLRQSVGKVSELALGFGGGVSAFHSMSKNYHVKLDPLYGPVWGNADDERREKAVKRYENALARGKESTAELSREAWIACELVKVGWRATNPEIAKGWRLREQAIRDAIASPGSVTGTLKFQYTVQHGFLFAKLPSGRCLAYASPKLTDQVWAEVRLADGSFSDAEVMDRTEAEAKSAKGLVRIQGHTSPRISALGVNGTTKKWERFGIYGGFAAENDTQAIARDLLVNGMRKAEAAGYPIVMHVYDEMVAEVPRGSGDLAAFERLICELPGWAAGLPLQASGWRGKRYRKG